MNHKRLYALVAVLVLIGVWLTWKPAKGTAEHSAPAIGTSSGQGPSHTGPDRDTARNAIAKLVPRSQSSMPSGVAQSTILRTPLPPLNAPMRVIYLELKDRADKGDSRAQCRLAFELNRCSMAKSLNESASRLQQELATTDPSSPRGRSLAEQLAWQSGLADKANVACDGFTPDKKDESWRYQLAAAEGGNLSSIVKFVMVAGSGLDWKKPLATLDGWIAYRDEAPILLQRALDAGYPPAYSLAATFSVQPKPILGMTIFPQDRVRGAAYELALMSVASPASGTTFQDAINRLHLSDSELAAASAVAPSIASKIKLTNGPVDFSGGFFPRFDGSECED